MAKYVILAELTQKGRENVDDLSISEESLDELVGDRDVEFDEVLLTMGQYDFVAIVDAPDGETLADVLVDYAGQGVARTETMQAFLAEEHL